MSEEENIAAGFLAIVAGALGIGAIIGRDKLGKQTPPTPAQQQAAAQHAVGLPAQAPQSPATAPQAPAAGLDHNVLVVCVTSLNGAPMRGAYVVIGETGFKDLTDAEGRVYAPMSAPRQVEVAIFSGYQKELGAGVQYPVSYKGGLQMIRLTLDR